MPSRIKELTVKELTKRFATIGESGCVVMGFTGLKAQESDNVRRLLSSRGARVTVVRNSLFVLALDSLGVRELGGVLEGPTAIVTGADPVSTAKAAHEATGSYPSLRLLGGYAEGHVLDSGGVERLASLPGREALLARVLGCMCAPAQRFAGCLVATAARLASVIDQLRKKRAEEQSDPAA